MYFTVLYFMIFSILVFGLLTLKNLSATAIIFKNYMSSNLVVNICNSVCSSVVIKYLVTLFLT